MKVACLMILAVAVVGCSRSSIIEPEQAVFPSVGQLDRIVSGSQADRDLVAKSAGVTEFSDLPTLGWLLEPTGPDPEWVILRIPYAEGLDDKPWTRADADTPHEIVGNAACAVADYNTGAWRWQDCTEIWTDGVDRVAAPMDEDMNPWSPAGYCYIAVASWGEGSSVVANGLASLRWDGP